MPFVSYILSTIYEIGSMGEEERETVYPVAHDNARAFRSCSVEPSFQRQAVQRFKLGITAIRRHLEEFKCWDRLFRLEGRSSFRAGRLSKVTEHLVLREVVLRPGPILQVHQGTWTSHRICIPVAVGTTMGAVHQMYGTSQQQKMFSESISE
jgi:hypothetical protein